MAAAGRTRRVTVSEVDARQSEHEVVCAERYSNLLFRMGRMERVVMGSAAAVICGMGAIILKAVVH